MPHRTADEHEEFAGAEVADIPITPEREFETLRDEMAAATTLYSYLKLFGAQLDVHEHRLLSYRDNESDRRAHRDAWEERRLASDQRDAMQRRRIVDELHYENMRRRESEHTAWLMRLTQSHDLHPVNLDHFTQPGAAMSEMLTAGSISQMLDSLSQAVPNAQLATILADASDRVARYRAKAQAAQDARP